MVVSQICVVFLPRTLGEKNLPIFHICIGFKMGGEKPPTRHDRNFQEKSWQKWKIICHTTTHIPTYTPKNELLDTKNPLIVEESPQILRKMIFRIPSASFGERTWFSGKCPYCTSCRDPILTFHDCGRKSNSTVEKRTWLFGFVLGGWNLTMGCFGIVKSTTK